MRQTRPINVIMGLPDDRRVTISSVRGLNALDFVHAGTASFLNQLRNARNWNYLWIGPGAPEKSPLAPGPLLNYIADADLCAAALRSAVLSSNRLNRLWFNHPARVLRTTRDGISTLLHGTTGIEVPKVIRVTPRHPADLFEAIARGGLQLPVLIRATGSHGGETLVRMSGSRDLQSLFSVPWGGRELYITQFIDYVSSDGLYRKYRLVVIGGRPFLRHVKIADDWWIRPRQRNSGARREKEECEALEGFADRILPTIQPAIKRLYQVLRLDYVGIDCTINQDGTICIFEANACMDALANGSALPNIWAEPIREMEAALLDLIDDPSRWAAA